MKSYKRLLVFLGIMMLSAIAAANVIMRGPKENISALDANSIVYTIKNHRGDLGSLEESEIGSEFVIFGERGKTIVRSGGKLLSDVDSPEKAAVSDCICIPVEDDGRYIGTIVLPDQNKESETEMKKRVFLAGGLLCTVTLLCALIIRLYTEFAIIRPFADMERFTGRIARGELDIPLKMEKDNLFGNFVSSFDIMREELKAAQKRENELKRRKHELIASLSHDLKTPITGIELICELLSVKLKDEYAAEKVKNIHAKAEELNVLVSDLLASELDDMGEMNVECRDEASGILHELTLLHDPKLLVKESELPECMINADRNRLSQIIGNIIGNSYKYADTPIAVNYRIKGRYLEMSFKDSGGGVPKEELPLITGKFYRGTSGKNSGKEGSGLGLYIASLLMEKMNGELICSSDSIGLTVTLLLPLA